MVFKSYIKANKSLEFFYWLRYIILCQLIFDETKVSKQNKLESRDIHIELNIREKYIIYTYIYIKETRDDKSKSYIDQDYQ